MTELEMQEKYAGRLIENEWENHIDEEGALKYYEKRCPRCEIVFQVYIPNKSEGTMVAVTDANGQQTTVSIHELEQTALGIAFCKYCVLVESKRLEEGDAEIV